MLNIISVGAISSKIMNGLCWWTDQLTGRQTAAKQNALPSSKWFFITPINFFFYFFESYCFTIIPTLHIWWKPKKHLLLVLVLSGSRGLFGVPLGLPLRRLTGLLSEDACVAVLSPCTWCAGKDWDWNCKFT